MSDDYPGRIAVTHLGKNGLPDHTVYSYGGLRRSFDSNKGQNIRNEHYTENGVKGSAVTPTPPPPTKKDK